jgi:hypothetical protein
MYGLRIIAALPVPGPINLIFDGPVYSLGRQRGRDYYVT